MADPETCLPTGTSEVEISAASQESGYTTMAAPSSVHVVDNMSMTIPPRTSQSSLGGEFASTVRIIYV